MNESDIGFDSSHSQSSPAKLRKWPGQSEEPTRTYADKVGLRHQLSTTEHIDTIDQAAGHDAFGNIQDSNEYTVKSQSSGRGDEDSCASSVNYASSHKLKSDTLGIESVSELSVGSLPSSGMARLNSELSNNQTDRLGSPQVDARGEGAHPRDSDAQSEGEGRVADFEH